MFEDLRWFGFDWQEGPDSGGPFAPYNQSERMPIYRRAFEQLRDGGFIYRCACSRKDIQSAARAPHAPDDEEPLYPGTCRPDVRSSLLVECEKDETNELTNPQPATHNPPPTRRNWRFRVPDGKAVSFIDANFGPQRFVAGEHFGDFVVWRHDDIPAYQLAVVADDAAMRITEVVRGADLLLSTARQLLIYRALGLEAPRFYHCALMTDESGARLAKRHDALSLRTLRERGETPATVRERWE